METQDIDYITAQINEINKKRYKEALVRARAQAYLIGELATK